MASLKSTEWTEKRETLNATRPIIAHDYLCVTKNQKETAKKFGVHNSTVAKCYSMYDLRDIQDIYGEKNSSILVIPNSQVKQLQAVLAEMNIPHRFATENAQLTESYESNLNK